jgi:hypothetical protein
LPLRWFRFAYRDLNPNLKVGKNEKLRRGAENENLS